MPHRATAWFLYPRQPDTEGLAPLVQEDFELREIEDHEVLAEPLYGCWGGNMTHALKGQPVDVCKQRREPRVVMGNSGIARVLQVGSAVEGLQEGDLALLFAASEVDRFGYPVKALGYDAPGTMGALATRTILRPHELLPIPQETAYSLPRWAASGASITAWSNWELAYGTFRLQVAQDELPAPHVWGWGGGTSLAELDLARRHGCVVVQLAGTRRHLELIEQTGIRAVDRRQFGELNFDEQRFKTDADYRRAYARGEAAFLREVERLTDGAKVQIFIDYIGTPVHRPTLKALSREGVITTAGWLEGMAIQHLRAVECIGRHQHIHTHYARYSQGVAAVEYAEANGWLPQVDEGILDFDQVPEVARRCAAGAGGYYQVFAVNPV